LRGFRGVLDQRHLGKAELDLERDEVLLGTVVEVALQPATLVVLSLDQALPR
jgi:hypothetical protein